MGSGSSLWFKRNIWLFETSRFTSVYRTRKNWNEGNKHFFEEILIHADYVNTITNRPYESPAQFRLKNEFIIQKTDGLLIVYDEEKEGTPKFMLQQAKKEQEKEII